MRLMPISNCSECQYLMPIYEEDNRSDIAIIMGYGLRVMYHVCKKTGKPIYIPDFVFPEWCPLEEVKE